LGVADAHAEAAVDAVATMPKVPTVAIATPHIGAVAGGIPLRAASGRPSLNILTFVDICVTMVIYRW